MPAATAATAPITVFVVVLRSANHCTTARTARTAAPSAGTSTLLKMGASEAASCRPTPLIWASKLLYPSAAWSKASV
jgi:hypothetical protein